MTEDSRKQGLSAAGMPHFETDEKILNALKRSNALSEKLIKIGLFLAVFQGISTLITVSIVTLAMLN